MHHYSRMSTLPATAGIQTSLFGRKGRGVGGRGGGGAGCVIVHQLFRRCVEIQTSGNVPTTYVTVKAKAFDLVN